MGWFWSLVAFLVLLATWTVREAGEDTKPASVKPSIEWTAPGNEGPVHQPTTAASPLSASTAVDGFHFEYIGGYHYESWMHGDVVVTPYSDTAAIGDVTGDGRNDLVTIVLEREDADTVVLVYSRIADGDWAYHDTYPIDRDPPILGTALADFNEDGTADVLVTRNGTWLELLLSDGDGGLVSTRYPIEGPSPDLPGVVADVNLDGHVDIVLHASPYHGQALGDDRGKLFMVLGDGTGGFSGTRDIRHLGTPSDSEIGIAMAIGDLNADGYPDIALRTRFWNYGLQQGRFPLDVFLHDGQEGFRPSIEVAAGTVFDKSLAILDANRDGLNDVASGNASNDPRLFVHLQAQNHALPRVPIVLPAGRNVTELVAADLDLDGREDLISPKNGWGVDYYLQRDNTLSGPIPVESGYIASQLERSTTAAGDLDGDGCPDLAVASTWYGLHVSLGRNCSEWRGPLLAVCPAPRATGPLAAATASSAPRPHVIPRTRSRSGSAAGPGPERGRPLR